MFPESRLSGLGDCFKETNLAALALGTEVRACLCVCDIYETPLLFLR